MQYVIAHKLRNVRRSECIISLPHNQTEVFTYSLYSGAHTDLMQPASSRQSIWFVSSAKCDACFQSFSPGPLEKQLTIDPTNFLCLLLLSVCEFYWYTCLFSWFDHCSTRLNQIGRLYIKPQDGKPTFINIIFAHCSKWQGNTSISHAIAIVWFLSTSFVCITYQ